MLCDILKIMRTESTKVGVVHDLDAKESRGSCTNEGAQINQSPAGKSSTSMSKASKSAV